MSEAIAPAVAIFAAVISGAFGYVLSGQIRGTTADKLWDISEKWRNELTRKVNTLEKENAFKGTEILELRRNVYKLETENVKLIEAKGACEARIAYLQERVRELEAK